MTAIVRLLTFFVAPTTGGSPALDVPRASTARRDTDAVGVLCDRRDLRVAGAAVGLWLARARRSRGALVCSWTPDETPPPGTATPPSPLTPGAAAARTSTGGAPVVRRLADRLVARDLDAWACGRLALVALPAQPDAASRALGRATAAAGDIPAVLVLGGARPSGFDPDLAAQDRLLVVPPARALEGMEDAALIDAARVGHATGVLRLPSSPRLRAITARGVVLPPAVRLAVDAAMRGDRG